MLYWTDAETAVLFCDLIASITAYSAEKHGSFSIFTNFSNQPATLDTLPAMERAAGKLESAFRSVEGQAGEYLRDSLRATKTFLALLSGEKIGYQEAVRRILGIELREISQERAAQLESKIHTMLSDAGYRQDSTAEQVRQWNADHRLDRTRLVAVAEQYLSLLQRETRKLVALPASEGWGKLDTTENAVWGALSQYQGNYITNVTLNASSFWKTPSFIDTVAHELYPGHHTWYTKRESLFREGKFPLEGTMCAICMAENAIFEGIPESAAHLLGLDDPERQLEGVSPELKQDITAARLIVDYIRILQINACCKYHISGWSEEQVVSYLAQDGWVEPAAAGRVFRYFSHPYNGLYYPAYYYGRWIVTYAYDRIPEEKRPLFFSICYEEPHTTATFIKRIEALTGTGFDPVRIAQE